MTGRHTINTLTSDDLDALYEQLDQAREGEAALGTSVNDWAGIATRHQHWGQRRWNAWKSARQRAREQRERAERAEGATERVRALADQWVKAGPPPLGTSIARWWDRRLVELNAALDEPKDHT